MSLYVLLVVKQNCWAGYPGDTAQISLTVRFTCRRPARCTRACLHISGDALAHMLNGLLFSNCRMIPVSRRSVGGVVVEGRVCVKAGSRRVGEDKIEDCM